MASIRVILTLFLIVAAGASHAMGREPVDLSNEGLRQSKADAEAKAKELLANTKASGSTLVLAVDYFSKKFDESLSVPGFDLIKLQPKTTTIPKKLADMDKKVIQCLLVAEEMLLAAEVSEDHINEWNRRLTDVLKTTGKDGKSRVFSPLSSEDAYWKTFLDNWQNDVIKKDSARFRDALRQAAYSILRVGLDIENEQIRKVLEGKSTPVGGGGGGGGGTISGFSSSSQYSSSHADVWHERMMNGIYRRHYRNMNKIDRITARR